MSYIGNFKDINDNLYTLKIGIEDKPNTIIFGDTPIITDYEGDKDIYKPVRYSSSTIKIVTTNFLEDLYSSEAAETVVKLYQGESVKWVGFITPDIYNQDFNYNLEELEIECIDGLSALKYYDYTPIEESKNIQSFAAIIDHILSKVKCYSKYYINDNISAWLNGKKESSFFYEYAYISEQNFFDEDDKPMKMNEVLEEICRYCGLSCMSKGDTVYFVDYDCTETANLFSEYNVGSGGINGLKKSLPYKDYRILADDYAESKTQISLDEIYNKYTVKANLYSFKTVLPNIFDNVKNINGDGKIEEVTNQSGKQLYKCFYKYYDSPDYIFHYYDKNTFAEVQRPDKFQYTDLQNLIGATPIKYSSEKIEKEGDKPASLNFKDYVLCHVHDTQTDVFPGRPLFEIKEKETKPAFLGSETYLVISGSAMWFNKENQMFILDNIGGGKVNSDYLYIFCELKIGNLWWDSDYNTWTGERKYFKLFFDGDGQAFNQSFNVRNNITWDMYLGSEQGFAVRLPNFDTMHVAASKPTLLVYLPRRIDLKERCDAVWLSDFEIKAIVSKRNTDDEDSDTEYSNVLSPDAYVKDFEPAKFKICTWDNKQANYSSPAYKTPSGYKFIFNFYHKGFQKVMKPEHLFINRHLLQYGTPSIILNMVINNEKVQPYTSYFFQYFKYDKKFMVDEQSIDWKYNINSIKLVQKK